jgi:hypothetical protein
MLHEALGLSHGSGNATSRSYGTPTGLFKLHLPQTLLMVREIDDEQARLLSHNFPRLCSIWTILNATRNRAEIPRGLR